MTHTVPDQLMEVILFCSIDWRAYLMTYGSSLKSVSMPRPIASWRIDRLIISCQRAGSRFLCP